jgi:hypothetical protein
MERIIKFRGLRIDTKEWIFGYLLYVEGRPFIFPIGAAIRHTAHWGTNGSFGILGSGDKDDIVGIDSKRISGLWLSEVLPESVGQFAGLKDKDETDIYEGDLFSAKIKGRDVIARADFIDGAFRCVQVDFVYSYTPPCFYKEDILRYQITVIGSIHTHPELIKQKV